jgi:hypothetical protein
VNAGATTESCYFGRAASKAVTYSANTGLSLNRAFSVFLNALATNPT